MSAKRTKHSAQQQQQRKQQKQMHANVDKGKLHVLSTLAIAICMLSSGIQQTNAATVATAITDNSTGGIVVQHLPLLQRALRDVTEPKDAVSGELMLEQPQAGQCLLDGLLVDEKTVYCEKQVGCRAIQKTGHCCPDYKCDCQKDGKTYSNGDKLVDPETPCTVCYCQGGEILCSSVTCFQRDDCKPRYKPGRCCPEYNDCPIVYTDNNRTITTTTTTTTLKPEIQQTILNPKITIKEITKPTEIRITDDKKAIPIHHMFKPATNADTTTSTTTTTSSTTTSTTTTTTTSTPSPSTTSTTTTTTPAPAPTSTTAASLALSVSSTSSPLYANNDPIYKLSEDANPIQAVLPMRILNNESLKLKASVAYPSTERLPALHNHEVIAPVASLEDFNDSSDKQLPNFDATGLQRVEFTDASDPSKVNIKREYFIATEGAPILSASNAEDYDNTDALLNGNTDFVLHPAEAGESDTDTAGSDNIVSVYVTTDGPNKDAGSRDSFLSAKGQSTTEGINPDNDLHSPPAVSDNSDSFVLLSTSAPKDLAAQPAGMPQIPQSNESVHLDVTTDAPTASTTTETLPKSTTELGSRMEEDDIAIPVESNPAYPSLPEDDFSIRDVNFPLSETDDIGEVDLKDEQRSITGSVFKSTKLLDDASFVNVDGSGSGGGSDLIVESLFSSTPKAQAQMSQQTAVERNELHDKAELQYSAEETSAEVAISNNTDFQSATGAGNNDTESSETLDTETLESLLMLGPGSGSGSGEVVSQLAEQQRREPTTPRPTRRAIDVDIDELMQNDEGSAAEPAEDPKLDAESLKLDNNENNENAGKVGEATGKSNILAISNKATLDKTFVELAQSDGVDVGGMGSIQRLLLRRVY